MYTWEHDIEMFGKVIECGVEGPRGDDFVFGA
jgi:hypothetical protein